MQLSSDAVILRVWPVNEADLIVSFLTRDFGKLKGVAKSALKSRRRFGGALEMMTEVKATFVDRPREELVRIDHFELIASPLRVPVNYARMTALSFFAEVTEQALPDRNPEELAFRLLTTVLDHATADHLWLSITYFSLWMRCRHALVFHRKWIGFILTEPHAGWRRCSHGSAQPAQRFRCTQATLQMSFQRLNRKPPQIGGALRTPRLRSKLGDGATQHLVRHSK